MTICLLCSANRSNVLLCPYLSSVLYFKMSFTFICFVFVFGVSLDIIFMRRRVFLFFCEGSGHVTAYNQKVRSVKEHELICLESNLSIVPFFATFFKRFGLVYSVYPMTTHIPSKGKLFLIVGPSGSGKGSAIIQLKKRHPEYVFPVSCTTRDPRPGEKEGEVYHYIEKEQFRQWIEEGRFLEWAEVHKDHYYGILKEPILAALREGKIVVREIDIQGYKSVRSLLPGEDLVGIFLLVQDLSELRERILKRGPLPEEEIARRMESAQREVSQMNICHYQVASEFGQVPKIVTQIEEIIEKETSGL